MHNAKQSASDSDPFPMPPAHSTSVYVDTGIRIESAADLCCKCLDDVAMDLLYMTGNDHALEEADPLELAEIKRRWEDVYKRQPQRNQADK